MNYLQTKSRTTFRILCRCLTGALGQTLVSSDLPANSSEWEAVLRLSSSHLVTPQLRWALWEQGLVSDLPADVADYLEAVYTLNLERNRECESQLEQLIPMLNSIGVAPVLLKGGAAIVGGLYPTSGERMITDLDILIPAQRLPDVLDELGGIGYRLMDSHGELATTGDWKALCHHYPPLFKTGLPASIELHVEPVDLPFFKSLTSDEVLRGARALKWRGVHCRIPSPEHFIAHNVIHAFLVNTQGKLEKISLRQLFEFVLANQKYGDGISWDRLCCRFDDLGYGSALRQYLALASTCLNYYPSTAINIGIWNRSRIQLHLIRLDLDSPFIEWTINFLGQIKCRLKNLLRKPTLIRKLLSVDFYKRWINSIKM
jgi:hypothetical protein